MLNASGEPARIAERMIVKHMVQVIAFVGMLLFGDILESHIEYGIPPSLAKEKSCRLLVVTILVAQKIRARMMYATIMAVPAVLPVAFRRMAMYG